MSLDDKFVPIRTTIYETVKGIFEKLAQPFGYPENPGMPTIYQMSSETYVETEFLESLPEHKTFWPPIQRPETWFEMIFGPIPKVEPVQRYIYENKEEGFYNFYIENYKNIFFLPDAISEFIQVKLNICLDISVLELSREALFMTCVLYTQIVVLRIALLWLIQINPFTVPWCYVSAAVDWVEDVLQGVLPAILGVNISATVLLGGIGIVADALNHIIFTMPFLPSEGERMKLLIDKQLRDVLVFHYLPISWYRHPIPNELREYWYTERPDILNYMQKSYKNFNIQFLPDHIVQELNHQSSNASGIRHFITTEMLSNQIFSFSEMVQHLFPVNII